MNNKLFIAILVGISSLFVISMIGEYGNSQYWEYSAWWLKGILVFLGTLSVSSCIGSIVYILTHDK